MQRLYVRSVLLAALVLASAAVVFAQSSGEEQKQLPEKIWAELERLFLNGALLEE